MAHYFPAFEGEDDTKSVGSLASTAPSTAPSFLARRNWPKAPVSKAEAEHHRALAIRNAQNAGGKGGKGKGKGKVENWRTEMQVFKDEVDDKYRARGILLGKGGENLRYISEKTGLRIILEGEVPNAMRLVVVGPMPHVPALKEMRDLVEYVNDDYKQWAARKPARHAHQQGSEASAKKAAEEAAKKAVEDLAAKKAAEEAAATKRAAEKAAAKKVAEEAAAKKAADEAAAAKRAAEKAKKAAEEAAAKKAALESAAAKRAAEKAEAKKAAEEAAAKKAVDEAAAAKRAAEKAAAKKAAEDAEHHAPALLEQEETPALPCKDQQIAQLQAEVAALKAEKAALKAELEEESEDQVASRAKRIASHEAVEAKLAAVQAQVAANEANRQAELAAVKAALAAKEEELEAEVEDRAASRSNRQDFPCLQRSKLEAPTRRFSDVLKNSPGRLSPQEKSVVVDLENLGSGYGQMVLGRDKEHPELPVFDWHGVRLGLRHLTQQRKMKVIAVIMKGYKSTDAGSKDPEAKCTMPSDILEMCSEPPIDAPRSSEQHQKSIDDEIIIKSAARRNCKFLSNDRFRDWQKHMQDEAVRHWLLTHEHNHMYFYFDNEATFKIDTCDGKVV